MCGIVCAFDIKESKDKLRPQLLEMSKKVRHRGPDWSGIYADDYAVVAHERLAIVDPASGKQPLFSEDGKTILAANGEIYNHRELRKQFEGNYQFHPISAVPPFKLSVCRMEIVAWREDFNFVAYTFKCFQF